MVFGDPVAAVVLLLDMPRQLAGFFDRVGEGLAFADHDQIQYGQGCHGVSRGIISGCQFPCCAASDKPGFRPGIGAWHSPISIPKARPAPSWPPTSR
jgi:hypothetical protein